MGRVVLNARGRANLHVFARINRVIRFEYTYYKKKEKIIVLQRNNNEGHANDDQNNFPRIK